MSLTHRRTVAAIVAGLGTMLAAFVFPLAVSAAPEPITFDIVMGDSCISGKVPEEGTFEFRWRDRNAATKVETEIETGVNGFWGECFDIESPPGGPPPMVQVGDRLRVVDGDHVRTFVVPRLTVNVDRVSDTVHGKAPAGTRVIVEYAAGIIADYTESKTVHANTNGHYTASPGFDVIGGLYGGVYWKSEHRDHVSVYGSAASIRLTLGESRFRGSGSPRAVDVFLEGPAATPKASATTKPLPYTSFRARFRDDEGEPVAVAVGDHLMAPELATDADWVVPGINEVADPNTDHVRGRCLNTGASGHFVDVDVRGPNGHVRAGTIGDTDEDGRFNFDFTGSPAPYYQPGDIRTGDTVSVACMLDTGDWVEETSIVP